MIICQLRVKTRRSKKTLQSADHFEVSAQRSKDEKISWITCAGSNCGCRSQDRLQRPVPPLDDVFQDRICCRPESKSSSKVAQGKTGAQRRCGECLDRCEIPREELARPRTSSDQWETSRWLQKGSGCERVRSVFAVPSSRWGSSPGNILQRRPRTGRHRMALKISKIWSDLLKYIVVRYRWRAILLCTFLGVRSSKRRRGEEKND
jgi:hypothetical protein